MVTRQFLFWRMPGIGMMILCALAAGWIAGERSRFLQPRLEVPAPNLAPSEPEHGSQGSAFSSDETPLGERQQAPLSPVAPQSGLLAPDFVSQSGRDLTGLTQAIAFYKGGQLAQGDAAAATAQDKTVRTALEWIALRSFPRETGFERLQAFMQAHPAWPALDWLKKRSEEALLGDHKGNALIKSYFSSVAPETPAGKLALARVLKDDGKTNEAAALARAVWREADINPWLEARLKADFGTYLEKSDHKYRADRLLYKEEIGSALRAATQAGPDVVALAKARAAVINEVASDKLIAAVPSALRSDPGFLFALIHKLRHAEKIRAAADIMLASPRDPALVIDGDEWWIERRLLARKLLDQNDAATAYRLCAEHSATSHEMRIEAEFHAGWIALRFLNDPSRAAEHFANLAKLAETPMSRARAAYWQGRAAEASSASDAIVIATGFYEKAAVHPATYYGQLARAKLGLTTLPIRTLADEAKGDDREDSIKVVELLYGIGEKELATPLVIEATRHLADETQMAALASIVAQRRDAHLSLMVGKIASQRGMAIDTLAFPNYGVPAFEPLQNSAATSVVYSIARQESAFDTTAVSSAGAKGLMQMILSTAKRTAQRAGVAFDAKRLLNDAAFNAQLAARHLGELLAEQHGSYILTFAAYNAGGKRVKEWIDAYGDPTKPGVDPVDWIERIPITETRNYVQRVMENFSVYRVRFGESTPTTADALLKAQAKL
jgi:soluble lytic murein transglycosylase